MCEHGSLSGKVMDILGGKIQNRHITTLFSVKVQNCKKKYSINVEIRSLNFKFQVFLRKEDMRVTRLVGKRNR